MGFENIIAYITLVLFFFSYYRYLMKTFEKRNNRFFIVLVMITINVSSMHYFDSNGYHTIGILLSLCLLIVTGMVASKSTFFQCSNIAVVVFIFLFTTQGIVVSTISYAHGFDFTRIMSHAGGRMWIRSFANVFSLILLEIVARTIATPEKSRPLFKNKVQLRLLLFYQLSLFVFILLINEGRYVMTELDWYSELYLISNVIVLVTTPFRIYSSIHLTDLIETETYLEQLEDQLKRQYNHYTTVAKHSEELRRFKHDFTGIAYSLRTLLESGQTERAIHLLDEASGLIEHKLVNENLFSNNVIIDAILLDCAQVCEDKKISFKGTFMATKELIMSDLEIVRVFTNLMNNAIEAAQKVENGSINFSSNSDTTRLYAVIENTHCEALEYRHDSLVTTKENREISGFGLSIVDEILTSYNCTLLIDHTDTVFRVRFTLPYM